MLTDEKVIEAAAGIAKSVEAGATPNAATVSLLQAIALTKDEATRHAMEREAAARAGVVKDAAITVLSIIFGLRRL
jgi:hypothetical protein